MQNQKPDPTPQEIPPQVANATQTPSRTTPPPKIKMAKLNFDRTQETIKNLEQKLGMRLICYYTSPSSRMSDSHTELFYDHLKTIGEQEKLGLVIISGGGSPTSALRTATLVRDYCKSLTAIIPQRAASAATILALSADKILMSSAGFLTAIDISVVHGLAPKDPAGRPVSVSADQVERILKMLSEEGLAKDNEGLVEGKFRSIFKYIHPLIIGEIDRSSSASELIATRVMEMHAGSFESPDKIKTIATHLVKNYPTHGFPILYDEAVKLGLPAEKASREISEVSYGLVKSSDASALPVATHYAAGYYHFECMSAFVESVGKRTVFRQSYDRRFNPVTKNFMVENDNTQWVNITPGADGKPLMSTIDAPVSEKSTDSPIDPQVPNPEENTQ